ncbi:hypothetical protein ACFE04_013200 [Oxalis oulophora]
MIVAYMTNIFGNNNSRSESTPNPMPLSNEINYQAQLENNHVNLNTPGPPQREMTLEEYLDQINSEEADNSIIRPPPHQMTLEEFLPLANREATHNSIIRSESTLNLMPQSNEINSQAQLENNHFNLNAPRPPQLQMTLEEFLPLANSEAARNSLIRSESTLNLMPESNEINYQVQLENNRVNLNTPRPPPHQMTLEEFLPLPNHEAARNSIIRSESTLNLTPQSNEINYRAQLENNQFDLNTPRPPPHQMTLEEFLPFEHRAIAGNSIRRSESTLNLMPQSNEINSQAQLENNRFNLNTPRPPQHQMTLEEFLPLANREAARNSIIRPPPHQITLEEFLPFVNRVTASSSIIRPPPRPMTMEEFLPLVNRLAAHDTIIRSMLPTNPMHQSNEINSQTQLEINPVNLNTPRPPPHQMTLEEFLPLANRETAHNSIIR